MFRGLSARASGCLEVLLILAICVVAGGWLCARSVRTRVGGVGLACSEWNEDAASVQVGLVAGLGRLGSFRPLVGGSQVVVVPDHASLEAALGAELCPLTVAAVLDPEHVLVQRPGSWPAELKQTMSIAALLAHELAHIAVYRESAGRAPLWLEEGIAAYLAGDYDATLLSLCDLDTVTLGAVEMELATPSPDPTNAALAYQLAGGAVWALVGELGSERGLHPLLQSLAHGRTLGAALEQQLGYGTAEFERRWRLALRRDALRVMSEPAEPALVEKAASGH